MIKYLFNKQTAIQYKAGDKAIFKTMYIMKLFRYAFSYKKALTINSLTFVTIRYILQGGRQWLRENGNELR